MRLGTKWTVVALLTASCWLSLSAECVSPPPVCEALDRAELVFHGRVSSVDYMGDSTAEGGRVAFDVIRAFKGVDERTFTGRFNVVGAEEVRFVAGTEVVVYGRRVQGVWTTACSRTISRPSASKTLPHAIDVELERLIACGLKRLRPLMTQ